MSGQFNNQVIIAFSLRAKGLKWRRRGELNVVSRLSPDERVTAALPLSRPSVFRLPWFARRGLPRRAPVSRAGGVVRQHRFCSGANRRISDNLLAQTTNSLRGQRNKLKPQSRPRNLADNLALISKPRAGTPGSAPRCRVNFVAASTSLRLPRLRVTDAPSHAMASSLHYETHRYGDHELQEVGVWTAADSADGLGTGLWVM